MSSLEMGDEAGGESKCSKMVQICSPGDESKIPVEVEQLLFVQSYAWKHSYRVVPYSGKGSSQQVRQKPLCQVTLEHPLNCL